MTETTLSNPIEDVTAHKLCSRCKKLKPTSMFTKNISRKDGLSCYCKPCKKIQRQRESSYALAKEKKEIKAAAMERIYGDKCLIASLRYDKNVNLEKLLIEIEKNKKEAVILERLALAAKILQEHKLV